MADMSPARRRAALAFVAVGIALIVQRTIASGGDADIVPPVERATRGAGNELAASAPPPVRGARDAPSVLRLDRLQAHAPAPTGDASGAAALFAVQSWLPPPPPPPAPATPAAPEAPPFPYSYMGGLTDERGRTAFFNRGDRVLAVRAGETVDGAFRVDQLDETSMTVTYVALNKSAQVTLGGAR